MQRSVNSSTIAGFGYRHFGPLILDWYNRLIARCECPSGKVFMLGRDGWNLVTLFNTLDALRSRDNFKFIYLPTSRALLSHISLSEPDLNRSVFQTVFNGTVRGFFECRLGLPFLLFEAEKWENYPVILPRDAGFIQVIFDRGRTQAEAIARASRTSYQSYLARQGVHQTVKNTISDLGFRGNSQALLTMLYNLRIEGFYAILDPSGVKSPLKLEAGTTFGLFSDDRSFGGNYAPLEQSLLLEAFLTSPYGQVVGIEPGDRPDPFLYRPATGAQKNFSVIAETMQGALKFAYDHCDLVGSNEHIIADFEAFFENFKDELKLQIDVFRPILSLDDSFFGTEVFDAEVKL